MKTTPTEIAVVAAILALAASCSSSHGNARADGGASCSPPCSGGATCALGRCLTTLASDQDQPGALAVSDPDLYWTSRGPCPTDGVTCNDEGTVVRVATTGGSVTTLATEQSVPAAIVTDGTNLYWVNDQEGGTVVSVPIAGGEATTLAAGQDNPDSLAVDATDVYWTNAGALGADGITAGTGSVMAVPLGGGVAETIASKQNLPHGIVVKDKSVYWANGGLGAGANGTVMSASTTGATPATLASGQDVASLAVDSASVYWTNAGSLPYAGAVVKCPLAGCPVGPSGESVVTTIASGQSLPYGIALDAARVYWGTEAGDVLTCPLAGCPDGPDGGVPTTLASGQDSPAGLAVDATSVYWTNFADPGTVMKLTPKD